MPQLQFPRLRWALVPLRLVIGTGFLIHGWAKLSRGPAGFAKLLDQVGVPFAMPTAWVATWLEILGGAAVLLGAFVSLVGGPLIVMMLVAMFTVHLRYGFSAIKTIGLTPDGPLFGPPGYEVNLLYVGGLMALMAAGPGAVSVGELLARRRGGRRAEASDSPRIAAQAGSQPNARMTKTRGGHE